MSRKIYKPDRGGWWLWREGGEGRGEPMLLCDDGSSVAYDDEWSDAVGREPNMVFAENYWEGTDTTQAMMPGTWKYLGTETPIELVNRFGGVEAVES